MFDYLTAILIFTAVYAMVALGLNIQWGMTGLINLGQVAFMLVGAYTTALLTVAGYPFLLAVIASALAAAALGVLVALCTPRLRLDYLAIVTLGFSEVVRLIVLNEKWLANGADGISGIPQPLGGIVDEGYPLVFLLLAALGVAAILLLSARITRFPFGRLLRAVREDESVVEAVGKHAILYKTQAFGIGAACAGIGGSFFATYLTFISPPMFTAHVSVYVLAAVLIARRGSTLGTLAGVTVVAFLLEGTRLLKDYITVFDGVELAALRLIALGAGLIAVVLIRHRPGRGDA